MAIRMLQVLRLSSYIQTIQADKTCNNVYDTFQRVGKNRQGIRLIIRNELGDEQNKAQRRYPRL